MSRIGDHYHSCAALFSENTADMDVEESEGDPSRFERTTGPAIVPIPADLSVGKLFSRWVGGRNVAVHCKGERNQHMTAASQGCVFEVHWEGSKWNRVTRKFVNQTHNYFMSLQSQSRVGDGLQASDTVRYSRLYRSALHECVLGLRKMADQEYDGSQTYSNHLSLYSMLELTWHLCEALFIEVLPAGCLIQQLLEWHSDGTEDKLISSILDGPSPGDHPAYWRCVYGLVLKGRLPEARDLLSHHSLVHSMPNVHTSIDELLRKAPIVRSPASLSRSELQRQWAEWRGECVRRWESGEFIAMPELTLLVKVLSGDEDAFECEEIISCCSHWYELMVSKLLYTLPLVVSTDFDLIYAAEGAIKLFQRERGYLDDILIAALRNDIMELIKLSSSMFANWWLVAHLSNLLNHKGLLVASKLEYGSKLSEFFLLEYASSLMAHPSLWQVAMDYFSECPLQGRHYMEVNVERIPINSERKATKVFRLCEKHQLKEEAQSLCRVQAMKAYKNGRLGVALSWCIRGKDSAFSAFLAEKYMDDYKSVGEFMDLDLLDHLGDAMLLNERLLFLAKYREYHQLYESGKLAPAGKLLVSLLLSTTVPRRFWSTLLTDALLLMEQEEVVFSTEQTYALSHLVQQLTLSPPPPPSNKTDDQSDSVSSAVDEERLSLLRLALTRNLSRAILDESSV